MNLSKAEILVYLFAAAVGGLAAARVVPWWVVAAGLIPCLATLFLERRFPKWLGVPRAPRGVGRIVARLIAPACIVLLAVVLDQWGAPPAVIAMICALLVVPYAYDRLRLVEWKRHLRELSEDPHRQLGATLEDWATFGISVVFSAGALWLLLHTPDWRTATITLVFFGIGALVIAAIILRKRRARRFKALQVSIEGSRNIPMAAMQLLPLTLAAVIIGAVMYFVGTNYPPLFRWTGAAIALAGAASAGYYLSGLPRLQFLRFEPEGIVIGRHSFEFRLPWNNIQGMAYREHRDNPMVLLTVRDLADFDVTPGSTLALRRLQRHLRNNRWFGADVIIVPWVYGLDAPPLLAALERYVRTPEARLELAPRLGVERKALPAA